MTSHARACACCAGAKRKCDGDRPCKRCVTLYADDAPAHCVELPDRRTKVYVAERHSVSTVQTKTVLPAACPPNTLPQPGALVSSRDPRKRHFIHDNASHEDDICPEPTAKRAFSWATYGIVSAQQPLSSATLPGTQLDFPASLWESAKVSGNAHATSVTPLATPATVTTPPNIAAYLEDSFTLALLERSTVPTMRINFHVAAHEGDARGGRVRSSFGNLAFRMLFGVEQSSLDHLVSTGQVPLFVLPSDLPRYHATSLHSQRSHASEQVLTARFSGAFGSEFSAREVSLFEYAADGSVRTITSAFFDVAGVEYEKGAFAHQAVARNLVGGITLSRRADSPRHPSGSTNTHVGHAAADSGDSRLDASAFAPRLTSTGTTVSKLTPPPTAPASEVHSWPSVPHSSVEGHAASSDQQARHSTHTQTLVSHGSGRSSSSGGGGGIFNLSGVGVHSALFPKPTPTGTVASIPAPPAPAPSPFAASFKQPSHPSCLIPGLLEAEVWEGVSEHALASAQRPGLPFDPVDIFGDVFEVNTASSLPPWNHPAGIAGSGISGIGDGGGGRGDALCKGVESGSAVGMPGSWDEYVGVSTHKTARSSSDASACVGSESCDKGVTAPSRRLSSPFSLFNADIDAMLGQGPAWQS